MAGRRARAGRWSIRWMYEQLDPALVDAEQLMWWMHRRIDPEAVPTERVNVRFDHTEPVRRTYWLLFEHRTVSVCVADPGFPADAVVTCPTARLGRVFNGYESWAGAVRSGAIQVSGRRDVTRSLPSWFAWSPWAADMRAQVAT